MKQATESASRALRKPTRSVAQLQSSEPSVVDVSTAKEARQRRLSAYRKTSRTENIACTTNTKKRTRFNARFRNGKARHSVAAQRSQHGRTERPSTHLRVQVDAACVLGLEAGGNVEGPNRGRARQRLHRQWEASEERASGQHQNAHVAQRPPSQGCEPNGRQHCSINGGRTRAKTTSRRKRPRFKTPRCQKEGGSAGNTRVCTSPKCE